MEHCVTVCIVPWSFVFSCVTYRHIVPALICSVGTGLNNVPWSFVLDCGTYRQSDLYCSAMGCADGVTHLLICPVGTGFNPRERGLLDKRRTKKSRPEGRQVIDRIESFESRSCDRRSLRALWRIPLSLPIPAD